MISCRAVAKILASDELAAASRWRRIEVSLHLAMCRHCTRFAQQLARIRRIAHEYMFESGTVPPDFEERVLARLRGEV